MTPRPYLSWSSLNMLEKNPAQWKEVYLYNKKIPVNRGMAIGKKMANGLEADEASGDVIMDLVMSKLPKFEMMDIEFMADLKNEKEIIKILCKPDTWKKDMSAFKEYKTSQKRWTKKQVDEFGQITFYAMGMFLKTGRIPGDIELVEVETKARLGGEIECTGEIYRHYTHRSMGQILQMMVRCRKAWSMINKICEDELL